jgi:hypothetical protein
MLGKNYEEMKEKGFKLTPEDIYSLNKGCLKDAVVGLGRDGSPFRHFCTGEIVSDQGLFLTNYHCGYGMIQTHSSVENDYLQDGFWAMNKEQELPNKGITASILVSMEDVTAQVLAAFKDDMSEKERVEALKTVSKEIADKAMEGTHYNAYVANMFNGNQFFLFVYVIYKDVRLVGTPPFSTGKFGGDTDNWMWPRHTCDFAMFRVYTAPDGSPAPFSKDNIPLKPKHFFPISIKGVEEGDFAMVMGFPGTTDRFLTSYGLEETMNITNKLRREIRDVKIDILRKEMASSQKIRIQYASKYASCSNYWKYSYEQNKALKNLNTMEIKKQIEADFTKWANANKDPKYKEALLLLEAGYKNSKEYMEARMYLIEALWSGTELPRFAYQIYNLLYPSEIRLEKGETYTVPMEKIKELATNFYKDYNPETEKKLIIALFEHTYKNMDRKYYPEFLFSIEKNKKCKGDINKCIEGKFATSIFATEEKFNEYINKFKWTLDGPSVLESDIWIFAGENIMAKIRELNTLIQQDAENLEKGKRLFVDGILQINAEKNLAPDANSTIRLTYGNVGEYNPKDAVTYHYYTTLKGVMEKEDSTSTEFYVPAKLKELYNKKDFGNYVDKNGEIVACFITNNDITGGNSGSPVINAEGHLIGLAFDGNSEAMSGDIDFEKNLQRCINLDVRYMLFVIDKFAGARHLIEEMKIVR